MQLSTTLTGRACGAICAGCNWPGTSSCCCCCCCCCSNASTCWRFNSVACCCWSKSAGDSESSIHNAVVLQITLLTLHDKKLMVPSGQGVQATKRKLRTWEPCVNDLHCDPRRVPLYSYSIATRRGGSTSHYRRRSLVRVDPRGQPQHAGALATAAAGEIYARVASSDQCNHDNKIQKFKHAWLIDMAPAKSSRSSALNCSSSSVNPLQILFTTCWSDTVQDAGRLAVGKLPWRTCRQEI